MTGQSGAPQSSYYAVVCAVLVDRYRPRIVGCVGGFVRATLFLTCRPACDAARRDHEEDAPPNQQRARAVPRQS